jgi:hypothetical protein
MLLATAGAAAAYSQAVPPWSQGANNPAARKGTNSMSPMGQCPDIHRNPADARPVIFIGGNQFFVLPKLITAFEQKHPELQGHIFYDAAYRYPAQTDRSGRRNYTWQPTLRVKPDVYEAGARVLRDIEQHGLVEGVVTTRQTTLKSWCRPVIPKRFSC